MAFALSAFAAATCGGFEVSSRPKKTVGGNGFLLTITGNTSGYYEVTYNDKKYEPYAAGENRKVIFLPVGIEASGKKKVTVADMLSGREAGRKEILVKIARRSIKTVHLKEKDEKMRSSEPIVEDQNKLLLEKIRERSGERLWKDAFFLPLKYRVSTRFALQRKARTYAYYHKGIDYAAPEGSPVKAAAAGKVIFARGGLNAYGNAMVIDHGQGVTSCYFHLKKMLKKEGDTVAAKEVIAESGRTGWATGPHLHFGVYLQGEAVDPAWWIKFSKKIKKYI